MNLVVASVRAEDAHKWAEVLRDAGFDATAHESLEKPAHCKVVIAVGIEAARRFHTDHVVLAIAKATEVADLPEVSDFCIEPVNHDELALRVRSALRANNPALPRMMHAAVESTSDVIEITDPNAVLLYVNPAFERILGFTSAEAVGKTPAMLIRSDMHPEGFFRDLDATLAAGKTWRGMLVSRTKLKKLVHLETTIAPVLSADGEITHHVAVKRDITETLDRQRELALANAALEDARDAALAASRAKSEFLAKMSHELRTPLNAIIGYAELLLDSLAADEPEHSSDLHRIRSAGHTLLQLVNDVLDIAKIEADKLELRDESFEIGALVTDIVTTLEPQAETRHNRVQLELADPTTRVRGDRGRLRQVLVNVVGNACKFTENGTISVASRACRLRGRPAIAVVVSDTGLGISPEDQERMFYPFEQSGPRTTAKQAGTGLGLAIARQLCTVMGGTIKLTSLPGEGSTFTVCIPLTPTSPTDHR